MINTLKQFEGWVTRLKQNEFRFATLKLTLFYVFSTACILLVSSVAVLVIFAPPDTEVPFLPEVERVEVEHDEFSLFEIREHLSSVIFLVDVFVLLVVSILSYFFARSTLRPIQLVHEQQRQFMSDVAHELRTPLSVMRSGAETMLRKQQDSKAYQEFVSDVGEESRRLTRLTDQLLQLLRAGVTTKNSIVPQDISTLVRKQGQYFQAYAKEHQVELKTEISEGVSATIDADGMVEVVQNLIKNAIDYNHPGGIVTLTLKETADTVVFACQDTGKGIPAEKQEEIFGRFTKLDTARVQGESTGAGLGLAIVKAIVERHRGELSVVSAVGAGTTISVILPK